MPPRQHPDKRQAGPEGDRRAGPVHSTNKSEIPYRGLPFPQRRLQRSRGRYGCPPPSPHISRKQSLVEERFDEMRESFEDSATGSVSPASQRKSTPNSSTKILGVAWLGVYEPEGHTLSLDDSIALTVHRPPKTGWTLVGRHFLRPLHRQRHLGCSRDDDLDFTFKWGSTSYNAWLLPGNKLEDGSNALNDVVVTRSVGLAGIIARLRR
jgi:hypothetical protein